MKIKKILITGSTGFLGNHILNFLLKNNFIVTDLIRKDPKKLKNLRKKFGKNYHSIKINKNLGTKLKNKRFDCFIHLATLYKKKYNLNDVQSLIEANINFPIFILKNIYHRKIIFINFGSMMEFSKGIRSPKNIYATSKIFFEYASLILKLKNQFNIKLYETFDVNDKREKIIPEIIKCEKKNITFKLYDKKLNLNFITPEIIFDVINKILQKKIIPGNYVIKNKQYTNIYNLIKKINLTKKNKIKYRIKFNSINFNERETKKNLY
jgi:nucleoside-diphosphate-sugar epimerase